MGNGQQVPDVIPLDNDAASTARMSEKLVRVERLKAVLRAREPDPERWVNYLHVAHNCSKPYASLVLSGKKSFGEKAARAIEESLKLPFRSLDGDPRSPMALYLADLFDTLPQASQGHLLAIAERFANETPTQAQVAPVPQPIEAPSGATD